jgi:hypothetical protein
MKQNVFILKIIILYINSPLYEMTKDKKVYTRYYVYKKINNYLYKELNKLGDFGKIFIKYLSKI